MKPAVMNVLPSSLGFIATAVFCSSAWLPSAIAQNFTATTDPVGFITLNVEGTGGAATSKLSFKGLGLTRPVEYQGSAETVGTNTLTDNEATWTDNQFNTPNGEYYVEIIADPPGGNSPGAGTTYDIASTNAANKTFSIVQNLATGVASGAKFKVRKHWTIASVFGPNNESGLASGDASTADQILVYNGTGYDTFFYQTGAGWRSVAGGATDAGPTKLYPEDGLIIKRRGNAPVNLILMGAVKTGQTSIPVLSGLNVLGSVYAANMTLQSSGIYTGNSSTGLAGGDATNADQVLIWNGTGYNIYYYQIGGFGTGWRSGSDLVNDAGATPITVGSSIIVKRNNGAPFDWKIPQHPTNL